MTELHKDKGRWLSVKLDLSPSNSNTADGFKAVLWLQILFTDIPINLPISQNCLKGHLYLAIASLKTITFSDHTEGKEVDIYLY